MSGIGQGGTGVLRVDGKDVATQKMEQSHLIAVAATAGAYRTVEASSAGGQ